MPELVLSLFPGIGLLDMAFEAAGFCIVRGPDLLWGGDIHRFHPPADRFDGVIGGSPCPSFSPLRFMVIAHHGADHVAPNLIPEFERVIAEARPRWFLHENAAASPPPIVAGYTVHDFLLDHRALGEEQSRTRRISFGRVGRWAPSLQPFLPFALFEHPAWAPAVVASGGQGIAARAGHHGTPRKPRPAYLADALRLQGLPPDFFAHSPFTKEAQQHMIGNGVPLPMGRALADAVRQALTQLEPQGVAHG